jgi:hypothetical protein
LSYLEAPFRDPWEKLPVALLIAFTAIQTTGQTTAARGPRPQGHPNFNGIWQSMTEANWDVLAHQARPGPSRFGALFSEPAGIGIVDGNEIPYQPWAAARQQENFKNRWKLDPEVKCYMPGIPRANYMPFPFQIIQGTTRSSSPTRLRARAASST